MIRAAWDRLRLFNIGELSAHRGRTMMSLTVMGVSAGLLVSVLSISGSVTGSVDRLTRGLGGDAVLEVTGVTDAGFEQSLLASIATTPGVERAVPMLRTQVGGGEDRALLIGADASIAALGSELAGPMSAQATKLLSVPNGVLVGDGLGRAEGEQFQLGEATVTVAGVLDAETSDQLNSGHIVVAPLPLAQKITDRAGRLDSVQILAAPGTEVDTLRAALTDAVGGRAVVADPGLRTAQAGGAIMIVRYSTLMASAAALIVSAFLIYNAMSMAVAQRRPTLSLLRAIGGKRGPMVRDLLVEAALLGLFGGAVGAVVGMFMGRVSIEQLPAAIVQSVEARTEYMVPGYAVPVAIAACVVASVAAAAIAARQVYKVQPIEALVPIGVGRGDTASPVLRWAAAVLGVGLAVAAVVIARTDLGRYSLAAISLSFAASVALCFAATGPIVRGSAVVARWFGAPGALGATTLERAPRRVWATMMTVMIGVAATVAMGGASSNMVDSATASFDDLGDTDLYVSPVSMEQFPTGPLLPEGLVDKIAALPEVEDARAGQMAFATLGTGRVMLQGYPSDVVTVVQSSITPASAEQMGSGAGVVLSRDVSRSLGAEVGDELTLPTPTGDHTVRVVQVIPYFSVISGIVVMDISRLHEWYQRPGETIIGIDLKPGVDATAAKAKIRELAGPELSIQTGAEAVDAISASLRQGTSMSNAILWIVVLVATVALLNTLMLSVLDRRRELGVLRAMGTGRKFLLRSVLAEAAGIGITGAAIGLVVGVVVQYLSTTAIGHAMTIDIVWQPSPLLLVYGTIALLLALLGSIPPALRAARMPIVEALAVD
ncbi:FtsX-like permease family protein [Nocardia cyriacigeorgica]|uniref:Putative transporter permease n=1 Tax=Nocardia cyriacigeorgica (strain GUH-2) TaxID=1127134 RepID=H6R723_NOCCG|nr:FtsX-like permease family protein [Nocardia cyriacigeorgica]MBF6424002.1 ABC transporter permease [Nocardia cyriacigeorgica]BDT88411.1 ABC transporter permease [Nocardia cyriacigeorgica]CCF64742.1 putative transporter permease [Nocardia cyriacigeorgica GUH-2]